MQCFSVCTLHIIEIVTKAIIIVRKGYTQLSFDHITSVIMSAMNNALIMPHIEDT